MALDWDILNEDFTSLAAWTAWNSPSCTATQVTEDGRSCVKLDSPATKSTAGLHGTFAPGAPTTYCTVEMVFKLEAMSSTATATPSALPRLFVTYVVNGAIGMYMVMGLSWDGTRFLLENFYGSSYYFIIADLDLTTWHTIRMVTGDYTGTDFLTSIWLDGYCYMTQRSTGVYAGAFASGTITLEMSGGILSTLQTAYIDVIRIDTTPEQLPSPLTIYDEDILCRYRQEGAPDFHTYSIAGAESLRIQSPAGKVLSIPQVATAHEQASKTRIYDGATVKSLGKIG